MKFTTVILLALALTVLVAGPKISIDQVDTTVRKSVFDGSEPKDWTQKIKFPMGRADYAFSLAEIDKRKFSLLKQKLGEEAFMKIVKTHRYALPKIEFESFKGIDRLPLYYYVRPGVKPGTQMLILVSMGEYQPTRYIAHIEGIWRVTGASLD